MNTVRMISVATKKIQTAERVVLAIGLALLAIWGGARAHRAIASRAAIEQFQAQNVKDSAVPPVVIDPISASAVDFRLWSAKRVEAYEDSLTKKTDMPLGILRIPKIHLEVPVFDDTDDLTLNRGVGRILGTAKIGRPGNLGIAGHRDGFFRGLKDVESGDRIALQHAEGTDQYVVSQIQIVTPDDTYVLSPTRKPTLTLVTCFPFYYVGSAPKRYVVTALLENSSQRNQRRGGISITTGQNTNNKEERK